MALADAKGQFIWKNCGIPGNTPDSLIIQSSSLYARLVNGEIIPEFDFSDGGVKINPVILGDSASEFRPWIIKPYTNSTPTQEQRNFNYCLSRARMVIECAFGKLKGRWRILSKRCESKTSTVGIYRVAKAFEEACLLEIKLRGGDTLLFACFYRSPTPTEMSDDNNTKLNNLLRSISRKKYSHYCILGDFNYRYINWQTWTTPHNEGSKEAKFIETIRDCFLHQHIHESTRRREMMKHRWSTLSSPMKPCKSLTLSTMLLSRLNSILIWTTQNRKNGTRTRKLIFRPCEITLLRQNGRRST